MRDQKHCCPAILKQVIPQVDIPIRGRQVWHGHAHMMCQSWKLSKTELTELQHCASAEAARHAIASHAQAAPCLGGLQAHARSA